MLNFFTGAKRDRLNNYCQDGFRELSYGTPTQQDDGPRFNLNEIVARTILHEPVLKHRKTCFERLETGIVERRLQN